MGAYVSAEHKNGEAIFHKVNENEYYRLIKGEKTNDKNSGN